MDTNFGFGKTVDYSFEEALEKVAEELSKEGFGILTEIDVSATMKKKLDKDMPPYKILGACNPVLANQAIAAVPEIGLLLPCNVLVRVADDGSTHVSFMDPLAVLGLVGDDNVVPLANDVKQRLQSVLEAL